MTKHTETTPTTEPEIPAAPALAAEATPAQPRFTLQRSLAMLDKLVERIDAAQPGVPHDVQRAIADGLVMDGLIVAGELERLVEAETGIAADGTADWCEGGSCGTAWAHVHGGDCTTSCSEGGCA